MKEAERVTMSLRALARDFRDRDAESVVAKDLEAAAERLEQQEAVLRAAYRDHHAGWVDGDYCVEDCWCHVAAVLLEPREEGMGDVGN